jgi:uroporphyrinogen decarboxylase
VGPGLAVQGNLDPALCLGTWAVAEAETRAVLGAAGTRAGHVFNLGHGVLPETDPGILEQVVDLVHAEGRAGVEGS